MPACGRQEMTKQSRNDREGVATLSLVACHDEVKGMNAFVSGVLKK